MAKTAAELAIAVTTDAADAVRGFDQVGDSATQMGKQVEAASDTVARSSRISADAAGDLATKTGTATGALGALAGGLDAVGLGPYAVGLQTAAIATDVASGASDLLALAMESQAVVTAKAKIATVGKAVADKAAAVAAKAAAVAQWALNAAMSANPIGLVVIAVLALVAGFVLAYKKSETFRTVVNAVVKAVVGYFKLVTLPIRTIIDLIASLVKKIPGVSTAFRAMRDTAKAVGKAILAPFQAIRDMIQKIVDLIGKIKLPKLPKVGGGVPFVPGIRVSATSGDFGGGTVVYNTWNLNGLLDTRDGLRALQKLVNDGNRRFGG